MGKSEQILDFHDEHLSRIIDLIEQNSGQVRVIGGAVRDALLGLPIRDIDIATNLPPEKILQIFSNSPFKAIATGIAHGTITIICEQHIYEITTLRHDIKTDGRHADVEFTTDFKEDAQRRDFTINAMSYDIKTGKIYDYFGGIDDLRNRNVRFIGDANQRIQEDYLRILRFFRFTAYFSDSTDKDAIIACKKYANAISKLSKERITSEWQKILSCPQNITSIFLSMQESGVLTQIFFGYELDLTGILNFEEKFWHNSEFSQEFLPELQALRLLFIIFILGRSNIGEYLKLMRFASSYIKTILFLYDFINNIIDLQEKKYTYFEICKIWYYSMDNLRSAIAIAYILGKIDYLQALNSINTMAVPPPKMPVTSLELQEMGFERMQLNIRKKYLESIWIKSGFSISKTELINFNENKK